MVQAGVGPFPSNGFPNPSVGAESLSVAVAVKNALNDPLSALKSDVNNQPQPNTVVPHVRNKIYLRFC